MQADWARLLTATLRTPRSVARSLIAWDVPREVGATALSLMAVLSAILSTLALRMAPLDGDPALIALFSSPIRVVIIQALVLWLTVFLMYGVGRLFGGTGQFRDTILLVSWAEAVLLLAQALQIVLLLVAPPLSDIVGLATVGLLFWLMSSFAAELHGFRSTFVVLLGMFGTILALSMVAAIVFVAFLGTGV
jgi:hypothetical protein